MSRLSPVGASLRCPGGCMTTQSSPKRRSELGAALDFFSEPALAVLATAPEAETSMADAELPTLAHASIMQRQCTIL